MVNDNQPSREPKYPMLWDKQWLESHYIKQGKTIKQIAHELGCYWYTVKNALVKLNIKRRRYTMTASALKARYRGGRKKARREHGH